MKRSFYYLVYILASIFAIAFTVRYAQERQFIVRDECLLVYREEAYFVVVTAQENYIGGYPKDTKILDESGKSIAFDTLHTGDYLLITSKDGVLLHESPPPFRHILEICKTEKSDVALAEKYHEIYSARFTH